MSKKPIIGGIILAAIIGVVFVGAQINPDNPENEEVWSIRMAESEWANSCNSYSYVTLEFQQGNLEWSECSATERHDDSQTHREFLPNLEEGTYKFGFVPMGDSPAKIHISIASASVNEDISQWRGLFSEEFILKGTPVDTGISKYHTWEYVGKNYDVYIPEGTLWEISITRSGNLEGSVTISLSQGATIKEYQDYQDYGK